MRNGMHLIVNPPHLIHRLSTESRLKGQTSHSDSKMIQLNILYFGIFILKNGNVNLHWILSPYGSIHCETLESWMICDWWIQKSLRFRKLISWVDLFRFLNSSLIIIIILLRAYHWQSRQTEYHLTFSFFNQNLKSIFKMAINWSNVHKFIERLGRENFH